MDDLVTFRGGWSGTRDATSVEQLEGEIAKLGSLAGEEVSWRAVAEHARGVLSGGPDLPAAAYLAQASLMLEGLPGLTRGLALVRDLLRDHWHDLHPPLERLRGRRSALLWP